MEFRIRHGMPDDWPAYREVRLRMLQEAPDAYGSSYPAEAGFSEHQWRERVAHPMFFLAVDRNDEVVVELGLPLD
jgi:hypothetical protein